MKKTILLIASLLVATFALDRAVGLAFDYIHRHPRGGTTAHQRRIISATHAPVLVFGSSRARHHYIPEAMAARLGCPVLNCGEDGNGIFLAYAYWHFVRQRYTPRLIVYDVMPAFDLSSGYDNHRYLGPLRAEYRDTTVRRIFADIDPTERYKMQSHAYRYNSTFVQYLRDYLRPSHDLTPTGFQPLHGRVDTTTLTPEPRREVDPLKLAYMERLIEETRAQGTRLVFVVSPFYNGTDDSQLQPLRTLCARHHVELLDYSRRSPYYHSRRLFADGVHLNSDGAALFSAAVARRLVQP